MDPTFAPTIPPGNEPGQCFSSGMSRERWTAHHNRAAAEVKKVGSKKNLTPRPKGKVSVYFNSKMILIFFQAMSHLDESQQDFCFPVLLYRGKASEVVAVPVQNSPQKLTACCQHHQTPPRQPPPQHRTLLRLSGEEQELKISF